MLHTCAVCFTEFLYRHCDLPVDRQDIYIYGAELFLSTSLSIISMLLISLVAGKPISGILFVLIFVGLRVFVGGFHAATYGTCFLLTNGVFLTAFLSSMLLENVDRQYYRWFWYFPLVSSGCYHLLKMRITQIGRASCRERV